MNSKRKIVIAFDSSTMSSLYKAALEEADYEVYECKDGLEALNLMFTIHPETLLTYLELPAINGFDLSKVIKNTPYLMDINVIICSSEYNTIYKFWSENSLCNGFYTARENNINELISMVKDLSSPFFMQQSLKKDPLTAELVSCITNALDNNLFNLYTAENAFHSCLMFKDIDTLVANLINALKKIYTYDALGIIVNGENILEFYDTKSSLSKDDTDDFIQVCRKDFESIAINRKKILWQKSCIKTSTFDVKVEKGKLKTYEVFPLKNEEPYPLSIHISTCRQDSLSLELRSRLDYFAQCYSQVFNIALSYQHIQESNIRIKQAFSRFVPQQYIDTILSDTNTTDVSIGESRKVAILISDIRNFTSISEINKPENVVTFLNKYFTVVTRIIKENGGTVDKFMGDSVMALFGATESYSDNAYRAAKAAYEMINALDTIDLSMIKLPDNFNFNIGVGINYGEAIVGSIGSNEKQDYTVIGDNVNLASRLESLNKLYGTHIIITEDVKNNFKEDFNTRLLDKVKVKGKNIPVFIYQIITEQEIYSQDFLDNYNKGVKLYLMGIWQRAEEYFSKALELHPEDKASKVLKDRCLEYIDNKPDFWDGSYTLTTK